LASGLSAVSPSRLRLPGQGGGNRQGDGGDKVAPEDIADALGERSFPDPLSPATPRVKIYGEAAMVSLKFKWFMRYPGVVAYQVKTILRS